MFSHGKGIPPAGEGGIFCASQTKTGEKAHIFPFELRFWPKIFRIPVTKTPADPHSAPILVSACLAGRACRFDGSDNKDDRLTELIAGGRAVLICPEEDGGLGTPRPPAEIVGGDGHDVIAGRARVVTKSGEDVTAEYLEGARVALQSARETGAATAVLKSRSPSCGKGCVYDGSFTRTQIPGDGVTTALLEANGIQVTTDEDF